MSSFAAAESAVAISPLLLANSGLNPGDKSMLNTLEDSGLEVVEAERVSLIYDGKGKPGKDSFFEAYVKEVLGEQSDPHRRALS